MIGGGEVAFHVACMLADRIGVITLPGEVRPALLRRWYLIGIDRSRITSIRSVNIPLLELRQRKEEFEAKFIEVARKQIDEEDAQAIIAGCLAYIPALGPNSQTRLEKILGVPVIHGSPIAVKFAEMMVHLNLKHSKKAYPK